MLNPKEDSKPTIFIFTTAYRPFIGGAEIAVEEVTRRLKGRFRFFIFTSRFRRELPKEEKRDAVVIRRIGLGFPFDRFILPLLGYWVVRRYAKKEKPDAFWAVMVTYASGIPYLINLTPFRKPAPIILTLQEGDSVKHIQSSKFGLIRFSWQAALQRTWYLTAISTFLLNMAREFGYIGEGRVVPNGVDSAAFAKEIYREEFLRLREKLNIGSEEKVVITTSRLVRKNAVDITIKAISLLARRSKKIKFVIIGSGEEEKELRKLAEKEGIGKQVLFLGQVPHADIPKYLKMADVFVRPSRSEGLGNAFIEAMAAGVPIVGTAVGGIIDFLEDGKTGLAARVDDPKDLANKIEQVISNPLFRSRLIAAGRQLVLSRFQWGRIANEYASVFETVIRKAARFRVLIATGLFPPDIGGPATYSKLLAGELPRKGLGVEVLSFGSVRHLPKGIRHLAYFWMALWKSRNADIIFAQDPVSVGLPSAIAAKILNKRFVLKVVGDYAWEQGVQRFGVPDLLDEFLEKRYGFRIEILRKAQRASARAANLIIVPSYYLKGVVAKWGIPEDKIRVVYNAFEADGALLPSRDEVRAALHLSGRIAISVGRLVPWKGFMTLVDIVPEIVKDIPDFKLIIVGSGPEEEHIRSKVSGLGISDKVMIIGQVSRERLLAYLKAADVFVLNTAYEGFSHTLSEAMAAGTPVITTSVAGNTEIITNGLNGILVPYDNREELKRAIVGLCKNKELKRALVSNAKSALDKFSKVKIVEGTIALLSNL